MNRLNDIINSHEEQQKTKFKPTREFFKHLKIGHRRFYQLVRNEVSPTFAEMQRLADYFGIHILELHDTTIQYLPRDCVA